PAAACDLDGLSHGYGPMSALFAGAHQYKSLNGLDEAADDPATDTATGDAPAEAAARRVDADVDAAAPPPPSTPRRSFVAWAKARPKPAGSAEAPATWAQGDPPRSADPSRAEPEAGQSEQSEQRQRPPGGGPVP
ncbi:MAG: hypothetical protein ACRC2H_10035, partial [Silanimonas sp.]